MHARPLWLASLVCFCAGAEAQQNEEEGLSGKVAFGYLATSGNTENENLNLNFRGDYVDSVSSLSADVWQNVALVLSYTIKRNSEVPVGTVRRDTFTAISLEYSF